MVSRMSWLSLLYLCIRLRMGSGARKERVDIQGVYSCGGAEHDVGPRWQHQKEEYGKKDEERSRWTSKARCEDFLYGSTRLKASMRELRYL